MYDKNCKVVEQREKSQPWWPEMENRERETPGGDIKCNNNLAVII